MSRTKIIQSILENKNAPSFSEKAVEEIKQYFKDESLDFSKETTIEIIKYIGTGKNTKDPKKIINSLFEKY